MSFYNAFVAPSRTNNTWFSAGLTSSFPDITTSDSTTLTNRLPLPCSDSLAPACKAFLVPRTDPSQTVEVDIDDAMDGLSEQVIVFQYRGKFHAVDHSCPHSSYPLSRGTPFDIEDFGIRLSAGLRCPKHDWSFDLFRGNGDRGSYRLNIWEVQLRSAPRGESPDGGKDVEEVREVWVRRKQRIG